MPHYLFDVLANDGRRIDDKEGAVLPHDEEAEMYAARIVDELKRDEPDAFLGYCMEVREGDRIVAIVPFFKPN
jgi:hypothetical protein